MATHPNNLKRAIEAAGRHRKWIAGQLGISRVTLHRYEHGMYRVPDEMQDRLVDLLPEIGMTREQMFPELEVLADAA